MSSATLDPGLVEAVRAVVREELERSGAVVDGRRALSKPQAATYLGGISVRTLDRLIEDGELTAILVRGRKKVEVAVLDRYLDRQRQGARAGS